MQLLLASPIYIVSIVFIILNLFERISLPLIKDIEFEKSVLRSEITHEEYSLWK